jgi:anthranilate phosphoribosyltransferase
MGHAMPPRREIGIRTIFNILGPLTNPANASAQVLGVYDPKLSEPIAQVLGRLGVKRALVVHGAGGIDEVSITGETLVSELRDGNVANYSIKPGDFGLPEAGLEELKGGTKEENASILRSVLAASQGPRRDVVLLNAAAALIAAGKVDDLNQGVSLAARSIDSGSANEKLEALIEFSNRE